MSDSLKQNPAIHGGSIKRRDQSISESCRVRIKIAELRRAIVYCRSWRDYITATEGMLELLDRLATELDRIERSFERNQ